MEDKKNKFIAFLKSLVGDVEVEASEEPTQDTDNSAEQTDTVSKLVETVEALTKKVESFEANLSTVTAERDEAVKEVEDIRGQAKEFLTALKELPAEDTKEKAGATVKMSAAERAIAMGQSLLNKDK